MQRVSYVFCHGLNGCGRYDPEYEKRPYWGGRSGDVVAGLRGLGYGAYAASVAPQGSAWDRACELFAQIAGVRCDYGRAHSERCRHARFGRDFSGDALIPSWDAGTRLVLVGHSFGGATVRLLSELLANGSAEERAATPAGDLSPLFAGGLGERVRAIVTLAAPSNGTTAYELARDEGFDAAAVRVPLRYRALDRVLKSRTAIRMDGRDRRDWASHDMLVDGALRLNERISTLPHVYYLSLALVATRGREGAACAPDPLVAEPLFYRTSALMGRYGATTPAGFVLGDEWHANDGLVNTVSARAPLAAPQRPLDAAHVERGVWNVMPDLRAHHAFFQGGYLRRTDPHPFFRNLMVLLENLD